MGTAWVPNLCIELPIVHSRSVFYKQFFFGILVVDSWLASDADDVDEDGEQRKGDKTCINTFRFLLRRFYFLFFAVFV